MNNSIPMQYQTPLPDDTDFTRIQSRINEIAPIFDRLPGMHFKLYGLNGPENAASAEYSSIYLWESPAPMHDFLSGELFANYSAVFARPVVRWYLVHAARGDISSVRGARWAVRRLVPLPRQTAIEVTLARWEARFARPEALVQVIGFDPTNWEAIDLTVWVKAPQVRDLDHLYTLARTSVPQRLEEAL